MVLRVFVTLFLLDICLLPIYVVKYVGTRIGLKQKQISSCHFIKHSQ